MEMAIGESSRTYDSTFLSNPPVRPRDLLDVRSPPPVSKDIGSEALVMKGAIADSGMP